MYLYATHSLMCFMLFQRSTHGQMMDEKCSTPFIIHDLNHTTVRMAVLRRIIYAGEEFRIKEILHIASGNVAGQSIIKVSMEVLQMTQLYHFWVHI